MEIEKTTLHFTLSFELSRFGDGHMGEDFEERIVAILSHLARDLPVPGVEKRQFLNETTGTELGVCKDGYPMLKIEEGKKYIHQTPICYMTEVVIQKS